MSKFDKTIKLFLIDGDPNNRMNCELNNWRGNFTFELNKIYN